MRKSMNRKKHFAILSSRILFSLVLSLVFVFVPWVFTDEGARVQDIREVRQALEQASEEILQVYERKIPPEAYRPGGTVNTEHPKYQKIKRDYRQAVKSVDRYYQKFNKQRYRVYQKTVEGLLGAKKIGNKPILGGRHPKYPGSDIDAIPMSYRDGKMLARTFSQKGYRVLEMGERWEIPEIDLKIWKPRPAVRVGSSAADAARVYAAMQSDQFSTPGAVNEATGGKLGYRDPEGKEQKYFKAGNKPKSIKILGKQIDIWVSNQTTKNELLRTYRDILEKATGIANENLPGDIGRATGGFVVEQLRGKVGANKPVKLGKFKFAEKTWSGIVTGLQVIGVFAEGTLKEIQDSAEEGRIPSEWNVTKNILHDTFVVPYEIRKKIEKEERLRIPEYEKNIRAIPKAMGLPDYDGLAEIVAREQGRYGTGMLKPPMEKLDYDGLARFLARKLAPKQAWYTAQVKRAKRILYDSPYEMARKILEEEALKEYREAKAAGEKDFSLYRTVKYKARGLVRVMGEELGINSIMRLAAYDSDPHRRAARMKRTLTKYAEARLGKGLVVAHVINQHIEGLLTNYDPSDPAIREILQRLREQYAAAREELNTIDERLKGKVDLNDPELAKIRYAIAELLPEDPVPQEKKTLAEKKEYVEQPKVLEEAPEKLEPPAGEKEYGEQPEQDFQQKLEDAKSYLSKLEESRERYKEDLKKEKNQERRKYLNDRIGYRDYLIEDARADIEELEEELRIPRLKQAEAKRGEELEVSLPDITVTEDYLARLREEQKKDDISAQEDIEGVRKEREVEIQLAIKRIEAWAEVEKQNAKWQEKQNEIAMKMAKAAREGKDRGFLRSLLRDLLRIGGTAFFGKLGYDSAEQVVEAMFPSDSAEEVISAPATSTPTATSGLSDITVNTTPITLFMWDHATEDGDRINIYLNGSIVRTNITITNAKQQVVLMVRLGSNEVEIKALNQGSVGPNTAAITITGVVKGKKSQQWDLKTGEVGRMRIWYQQR